MYGGRAVVLTAVSALLCALTGCGGDAGGRATLTWYATGSAVDAAALANTCAEKSDGAYRVRVEELPADADDRHTALVRRLSANNDSVDVLSVDTTVLPELAGAGYLRPLDADQRDTYTDGMLESAVSASSVGDRLVAAPWLFDPTLLWTRGVAAERAGLDLTEPVAWTDLIDGAARLGVSVQIDADQGAGLSSWIEALIAGAGGRLVDGPDRDAKIGLDTAAGRIAASVVQQYARADVGPGPARDAVEVFAGATGGFLVAPGSALADPAMQRVLPEVRTAAYPVDGEKPINPVTAVSLAVTRDSARPGLAHRLIECLTSADVERGIMTGTGTGTARSSLYDDRVVKRDLSTLDAMAAAVEDPHLVPATPYWSAVRRALDDSWSPLSSVTERTTPARSQRAVTATLRGELP